MQPSPVPSPQDRPAGADSPNLIRKERAGGRWIPPVNDPAEALEFCRALAAAIEKQVAQEYRRLGSWNSCVRSATQTSEMISFNAV